MQKKYVMALDAGTTSNRAIIFDEESRIVSVSQKEFTQYFPQPGWVEHDANEILHTMVEVMKGALEQSGLTAADISAIGITNQRETAVVWDKTTGCPIYNAIVWQSRQTAAICEDLIKQGLLTSSRKRRAWSSTLISPARRSNGFWILSKGREKRPKRASSSLVPLIRGSSGSSAAARYM